MCNELILVDFNAFAAQILIELLQILKEPVHLNDLHSHFSISIASRRFFLRFQFYQIVQSLQNSCFFFFIFNFFPYFRFIKPCVFFKNIHVLFFEVARYFYFLLSAVSLQRNCFRKFSHVWDFRFKTLFENIKIVYEVGKVHLVLQISKS